MTKQKFQQTLNTIFQKKNKNQEGGIAPFIHKYSLA